MFRDSLFFLKFLPHFWQCNALNVFSIWMITYIKLGVSHLWKKFQDEIVHQRTFTKKAPNFFLAPCWRYQDTIHLLQNPKLPRNTMGFNNHNLSHKTLKDRALRLFFSFFNRKTSSFPKKFLEFFSYCKKKKNAKEDHSFLLHTSLVLKSASVKRFSLSHMLFIGHLQIIQ